MSVFQRSDQDGFTRGTRAIIVLPDFQSGELRSVEARLEEAAGLAAAIGIDVVDKLHFRVRSPKAATLFGSGQVDSIALAARQEEVELVIVDAALAPVQQSNLEKAFQAKVIDRTGLILEIFGERAATAEGRLQVELAHLDYQAGRLVRSWTHLERQRGGFGFLGGPGETQIEADRRMIRDRMARLRRELDQVRKTRSLHRSRRRKAPWPVIALVGYTNAGKSTLFNRMTGATVMAQNLLFATLDPTMRQISLPGIEKAILSDTVGFVSDLPTQLVAAFRATLEEVTAADLILHVRDISHEDSDAQAQDVADVLKDIGIGVEAEHDIPVLEVWNKIDVLDGEAAEFVFNEAAREDMVVPVSAITGEGVETLERKIDDMLAKGHAVYGFSIPVDDGASIAWLHAHGEVVSQDITDAIIHLDVRMSGTNLARFAARRSEQGNRSSTV